MRGESALARCTTGACLVLALACPVAAQPQAQASGPTNGREGYDQLVAKYLAEARAVNTRASADPGWAWMNNLAMDTRARGLNDLVTIRVIENITATGTADSALSKDSDGTASLFNLFGLERKIPKLFNPTPLLGGRTSTDFSGSGATSRAGALTANLTARVSEVLPNGDLVVEGIREIDINGDRQILVLTGVIRPFDIDQANVVESTAVGQLRIRYFGQGLMKDNLRPGFVVRLLNLIF